MNSPFEQLKHVDENGEYWLAREMQSKLSYVEWRKFEDAIERAMISCKIASHKPSDHFVPSANMIKLGKGAKRKQKDYRLTRYACYLIAMNGDPRKEAIAQAQAYFTAQTYYAETVQSQKALPSPTTVVPQHKLTDLLAERAKLNMSQVPSHYYSVMGVLFLHVYNLENMVKDLDAQASIEISTGSCWSHYATEVLHIPDSDKVRYLHTLPNGKVVEAWAYSHKWQRDFEVWLWTIYFPEKFPKYFGYRVKKVARDKGVIEAPKTSKVKQIGGRK